MIDGDLLGEELELLSISSAPGEVVWLGLPLRAR